jgi:hypothetical protein
MTAIADTIRKMNEISGSIASAVETFLAHVRAL